MRSWYAGPKKRQARVFGLRRTHSLLPPRPGSRDAPSPACPVACPNALVGPAKPETSPEERTTKRARQPGPTSPALPHVVSKTSRSRITLPASPEADRTGSGAPQQSAPRTRSSGPGLGAPGAQLGIKRPVPSGNKSQTRSHRPTHNLQLPNHITRNVRSAAFLAIQLPRTDPHA